MHYNVLLVLFINVALCRSRETDTPTFWNQIIDTTKITAEQTPVSVTQSKVQLKVYYETLCPASIQFVVDQLKPAVNRLSSYLDVHLIPYGHATTNDYNGHYYFRCQHGPKECYGNKVHACVIDVVHNNTHAVLFNACLMDNFSSRSDYSEFVAALRLCGKTEKVRVSDIWECMSSGRGSRLLKAYGDETHQIELPYVPFMIMDGSSNDQDDIAGNLIATICKKLDPKPAACSSLDE